MKKSIKINSKEYEIPEVKFSTLRAMEKAGVNFLKGEEEPFEFYFQLFKFFSGLNEKTANEEIEAHFENGGGFNDLAPLGDAVASFFTKTKKRQK